MIVPEGYWEIANVFNEIGQIHYGDVWTGAESNARQLPNPDEISARRQKEAEDYEELKRTHGAPPLRQAPGKPPGHFIEFNPFADDSLPDPDNKEYLAEREARERHDEIEHHLIERLYSGAIPVHLKDQYGEIHNLPSRLWQSIRFRFFFSSSWAEWRADERRTYTGSLLVKIVDAKPFLKGAAKDSALHQGKVVRLPGRPTIMPEIECELRRRFDSGEEKPTMYGEAQYLAAWAKNAHPGEKSPGSDRIRNALGQLYKELAEKKSSRN